VTRLGGHLELLPCAVAARRPFHLEPDWGLPIQQHHQIGPRSGGENICEALIEESEFVRSYDETACKIGVFVRLSVNIAFGAAPEPLPALSDVRSDLARIIHQG